MEAIRVNYFNFMHENRCYFVNEALLKLKKIFLRFHIRPSFNSPVLKNLIQ